MVHDDQWIAVCLALDSQDVSLPLSSIPIVALDCDREGIVFLCCAYMIRSVGQSDAMNVALTATSKNLGAIRLEIGFNAARITAKFDLLLGFKNGHTCIFVFCAINGLTYVESEQSSESEPISCIHASIDLCHRIQVKLAKIVTLKLALTIFSSAVDEECQHLNGYHQKQSCLHVSFFIKI